MTQLADIHEALSSYPLDEYGWELWRNVVELVLSTNRIELEAHRQVQRFARWWSVPFSERTPDDLRARSDNPLLQALLSEGLIVVTDYDGVRLEPTDDLLDALREERRLRDHP